MLSEAEWSGVGTDSTEEQSEPERPGIPGDTDTSLFTPHSCFCFDLDQDMQFPQECG